MSDDAQEAALGLLGLINTTSTPVIPQKRKQPMPPPPSTDADEGEDGTSTDSIRCICSFTYDDGWSVACDRCGRWYHGACVEIAPGAVPQFWVCPEHVLERDPAEDQARRERAQAIQRQWQRKMALTHEQSKALKRRTSPGVEKKQRRISSGEVKRRRRSMSKPVPPLLATQVPQPNAPGPSTTDEDEHIEIDVDDTYVQIAQDAVSLQETREKLSRNAQNWRGVTALDVTEDDTYVQSSSTSSIRPSYALHTAAPVRTNDFIAPYTSTVTPSTAYLADPLNAYAHLGMPKPFVHLIGPPHNVALDSRIRGNRARFARSGCNPNSVLRPYLCGDQISFGIFALRDMKENEEVVLGWEWDDGNAIHHLPAVLEHPELFTQEQHQYLRFQLANLLHSLGSTFATCACGNESKHCALKRISDFVDGVIPDEKLRMGPLVGTKRGFQTKERVSRSSGISGVEMVESPTSSQHVPKETDLQKASGFVSPVSAESSRISEELRFVGVNLQDTRTASPVLLDWESDGKEKDKQADVPPVPHEDLLPPKMRKRWIQEKREALKELDVVHEPIQVDPEPQSLVNSETQTMPVPAPVTPAPLINRTSPPLPPHRQTAVSSLLNLSNLPPAPSPSAQFASLTLHSPAFTGFVPPAIASSPLAHKTLSEPETHVRFATSPPIVYPISSPPPSYRDMDADVEMKSEAESLSPSMGKLHTPEASSEPEPASNSASISPNISPQFEAKPLTSPATTPSPLHSTLPAPSAKSQSPPSSPPLPHTELEFNNSASEQSTSSPLQPQPPKVKMSLKDFAMRRKKEREEKAVTRPEELASTLERTPESIHVMASDPQPPKPESPAPAPESSKRSQEMEKEKEKEAIDAEVLKQAHINRSTLSFGSFGIDDDIISEDKGSLPSSDPPEPSGIDPPLSLYQTSFITLDTPQSPSPSSSPLSVSMVPLPTPSPELIDRRESQEEEGEITATTCASPPPAKNPPTQPRSFANISPPPRRLLPPPLPNRPTPLMRPPSGPRAFRQSFGNGVIPPRGPLADRDRDWERGPSSSWSSGTSRGRGRGSWVR